VSVLELEVPPLSSVRVIAMFQDQVELRVSFRTTHHVVVLNHEQALRVAAALTKNALPELIVAARETIMGYDGKTCRPIDLQTLSRALGKLVQG